MRDFIRNKLRESILTENRIKFNISIPNDIKKIKNVFVKNGKKLFIVGGAVRDAILGKIPKDYDLATDALPDEVESILNKAGYKTLPTGKAFGVINVFTDNGEYEIATFRRDLGKGRRPDSVEFTDINQDVMRRDLTINALFYDIDTGEVVDLVGGLDDIKNDVVRTVGLPENRFEEDRLRIMRAVRFAGRFGSKLEANIDKALQKNSSLEGISAERIRDEFLKGIKSAKSVVYYLQLLDKYRLFDWIFPKMKINKDFVEERNPITQIANILKYNDPKLVATQLNKSAYSVIEEKQVEFLLKLLSFTPEQIYQYKKAQIACKISDDSIMKFVEINNLDKKLFDAFIEFKLTVTGQSMLDKGIKSGPEMEKAIMKAEIDNFKNLLK